LLSIPQFNASIIFFHSFKTRPGSVIGSGSDGLTRVNPGQPKKKHLTNGDAFIIIRHAQLSAPHQSLDTIQSFNSMNIIVLQNPGFIHASIWPYESTLN